MKISHLLFISTLMLLALLVNGCTLQTKLPAVHRETQETLLVEIDQGWVKDSHLITPDNRSFIYVNNVEGQQVLVVNGIEAAKRYDEIMAYALMVSQDSRHIAYAAREGENWYMVYDGREIGPYDKILAYQKYMFMSPDGQRVLYAVQQDEKIYVAVNEKLYGPYEDVSLVNGVFSADSSRFAFVANSGKYTMMVDNGEIGPEYDAIPEWFFSPQGNSLVYHAVKEGRHCVVLNGTEEPLYEELGLVQFSPDGKRLAYVAAEGEDRFVVMDGQRGTGYPFVMGAVFSPDSKRLAYSFSTSEAAYMALDDKQFGPHDAIDIPIPVFSPDSQHIAYGIASKKGYAMMLDEKQGPYYAKILSEFTVISPDSSRLAYVVQTGVDAHSSENNTETETAEYAVVVDGRRGKIYDEIGLASIVFSPDSKHVAYVALKGEKWAVMLDGKKLGEYDDMSSDAPIFSPDSSLLIVKAQIGEEFSVFVNGQAGKPYDGIINNRGGKIIFDSDHSFRYLAAKDNMVYMVEEKFTPPAE